MLLLACVGLAGGAGAATVTTDKLDYPPLSDVYIDGAGWSPGAVVNVHIDQLNTDGTRTPIWDAAPSPVADANGAFTVVWYIWSYDFIGATLQVTATGLNSAGVEETATTIFTDTGPGIAPVNPPTGGFGIDGDLYANTSALSEGDWAGGSGGGGHVLDASGAPIDPDVTFHLIDDFGGSATDDNFGGGYKVSSDPNGWTWVSNPVNDKMDINNALVHLSTDAKGNRWLIVAGDRRSGQGAAYIDFEFLQNTLVTTTNAGSGSPSGRFVSYAPAGQGGRTLNDFIVTVELTQGGDVAGFYVRRWQQVGGVYQYVDFAPEALTTFAAANSTTIASPFPAFGGSTYARNTFAEAAVNLTAMIAGFEKCLGLEVKTLLVKTKESHAFNANIVDFIAPIQLSLRLGAADAGPDQAECSQGASTLFNVSGTARPSPGDAVKETLWSVVDGDVDIPLPGSLNTAVTVRSSSATLRFTVSTINGCVSKDDVVLTVKEAPNYSILGADGPVCPKSSGNTYSVEAGPTGTTYAWSISGNAEIVGPKDGPSVSVTAGSSCDVPFTVQVLVNSAGCQGSASKTVSVNDTTAPEITGTMAPLTVEGCAVSAAPAPVTTVAGLETLGLSISDACTPKAALVVTHSDSPNGTCPITITRTYTVKDACGNAATAVQTINVDDNTAPVITGTMTPVTVEGCAVSAAPAPVTTVAGLEALGVSISDACTPDASLVVTHSDAVSGTCPITITRTYTVKDACGNIATAVQTINVDDNTAPVITGTMTPVTVEGCAVSAAPAPVTTVAGLEALGVSISDACTADASLVVTHSDSVNGTCPIVITRTYTVKDACGNTATAVQAIKVDDTTAPVIIGTMTALTVEDCADSAAPAAVTSVAGLEGFGLNISDACTPKAALVVTHSDSPNGSCPIVITRSYTVKDACGNANTAIQIINVADTTAPAIAGTMAEVTVEGCAVSAAPTAATSVADLEGFGLRISDACTPDTSLVVTHSDAVSGTCPITVTRTYTIKDACGNTATAVQTIKVDDATAPVITGTMTPVTVEGCAVSAAPAAVTTVAALEAIGLSISDACTPKAALVITHSDSPNGTCPITITRTYTVKDACGNSANAVQTIKVDDTTAPVITGTMTPVTVEGCAVSAAPAPVTTVAGLETLGLSINDTCTPDASLVVTHSDAVSGTCPIVITRTYTVKDACGNAATVVQTINVDDTTAPAITGAMTPVTVEGCAVSAAPAAVTTVAALETLGLSINDTCTPDASLVVTHSDSVRGTCPIVITRTYTVKDACGNFKTAVQMINVEDKTPPVITLPANDLSVERLDTALINAWAATATARDNCSGTVPVTPSYTPGTSVCGQTITVNFAASDSCGNTATATKTFSLDDNTPPQITCPPAKTVECNSPIDPSVTGRATATDNSGKAPTIGYTDSDPTGTCPTVITRKWTATDECGNTASCDQLITVQDTTPPTIQAPANTVLCEGNLYIPSLPTIADTCGLGSCIFSRSDKREVSYNDENAFAASLMELPPLAADGVTMTVTATDKCGNSTTRSWSVRVTQCVRHCTFTQGYWGNYGGKGIAEQRVDLIRRMIGATPIVIGDVTKTRSLTIELDGAVCVIRRLPAGGPATIIPGNNYLRDDNCDTDIITDSRGKFRNNLLGQSIALALNLRYDPTLGAFPLSRSFTTWSIGSLDPLNVGKDCKTYTISQNVLDALKTLPEGETVEGLMALANVAVSDESMTSTFRTEIGNAVGTINEAFDECRIVPLGEPVCE